MGTKEYRYHCFWSNPVEVDCCSITDANSSLGALLKTMLFYRAYGTLPQCHKFTYLLSESNVLSAATYWVHEEHATRSRQIDANSTGFQWQQEDRRRVGVSVRECFNGSRALLAGHRAVQTHKVETIVSNHKHMYTLCFNFYHYASQRRY